MNKCQSNCGLQSIKLYFTLQEENLISVEQTHLESGDIPLSSEGYVDLTKEVRMFSSILDNPEIRFIAQVMPAPTRLCDICFKEKVDGNTSQ